MKVKHLGRIFLIFIFTTIYLLGAKVEATLEQNQIFSGNEAKLIIKAEGKNIKFPKIDNIGGFSIVDTSISTQVVYINGNLSQSKTKTYYFYPKKSLTIPEYEVEVDGNLYKTKSLELKVVKPTASKNGEPIVLELNTTKQSAMVGEPIELTLKLKVKQGTKVDRVNIIPPKLENFWVEQIQDAKRALQGDYEVVTYKFLITPQKSGELKIPPTFVQIGKAIKMDSAFDDPFFDNPLFSRIKWQKIYSNSLTINVKPLPNNLELFGHFLITANVDKNITNANEPVNLTIKVKGEGNLDDIKKFNIQIPNSMVYNNEPKVDKKIVNGKQVGEFTQKVAIVAENNYTIPSISLEYFDNKLQKAVTVKTNPINVVVKRAKNIAQNYTKPKIEVAKTTQESPKNIDKTSKSSNISNIAYLIVGLILGSILTFVLIRYFPNKKSKKELPIVKQIAKTKSDKELFKLLLPYAKDEYIKDKIKKLEENIYKNGKNRIDKNELIDYFEEIEDF